MIMVKTEKDSIFEGAYFLLRANAASRDGERDILKEANRIISDSCSDKKIRKEEKHAKTLLAVKFFFIGFLTGSFFLGLIWLVSALA